MPIAGEVEKPGLEGSREQTGHLQTQTCIEAATYHSEHNKVESWHFERRSSRSLA